VALPAEPRVNRAVDRDAPPSQLAVCGNKVPTVGARLGRGSRRSAGRDGVGGPRIHPITEVIVVVVFFSLSLAFVTWFERDKRRRDWQEPDTERPPVFAALEILQPAILSFILICIALMVMMWLLARSN